MLDQGIHLNVASADYFADPAPAPSLTQSIAKVLNERSPLHAWKEHPRFGGPAPAPEDQPTDPYKPEQAIGNAAHALMLGRGKQVEVVELDSWRGKAADQRREIEATGRVAILQKHFVRARNMVDAARDRFPTYGNGEVVLIWREGDIWLRTMIDWLSIEMLTATDYKTSGMSCAPQAIPALMVNGGWDIQAAMHERGLDVLDPENAGRRKFRFVAQENVDPYAVTVCELTEAVLTMGRKKLEHAIGIWRECMREDRWPSYPSGICYPELPTWAENRWLEREVAEDERRRHGGERDAANLMAG